MPCMSSMPSISIAALALRPVSSSHSSPGCAVYTRASAYINGACMQYMYTCIYVPSYDRIVWERGSSGGLVSFPVHTSQSRMEGWERGSMGTYSGFWRLTVPGLIEPLYYELV